jgi:TIR domain
VGDETFDVFISYGHQDADWVRTLAGNLHRQGLAVFFDEWDVGPGDVLVHQLEDGLLRASHGILVFSPAALASKWVAEEYAAMVTRAVAGQQRLIPVLLGEAELPPFAAARVWVDFRGADGPEYDRRVRELAAALRGERPARPAHDGTVEARPGSGSARRDPARRRCGSERRRPASPSATTRRSRVSPPG